MVASSAPGAPALKAVAAAIGHLAEREQTFRKTDLVVDSLKFDSGVTADQVDQAIDAQARGLRLVDRGTGTRADKLYTTVQGLNNELR